jgi:hypothetical protein
LSDIEHLVLVLDFLMDNQIKALPRLNRSHMLSYHALDDQQPTRVLQCWLIGFLLMILSIIGLKNYGEFKSWRYINQKLFQLINILNHPISQYHHQQPVYLNLHHHASIRRPRCPCCRGLCHPYSCWGETGGKCLLVYMRNILHINSLSIEFLHCMAKNIA